MPSVENGSNKGNRKAQEKLWNMSFGHALPLRAVGGYLSKGLLTHLDCRTSEFLSCTKAKHRSVFRGCFISAYFVSSLQCDTNGTVEVTYDDGHKYFLTVVDEFNLYTHVVPLRSKAKVSEALLHFVR